MVRGRPRCVLVDDDGELGAVRPELVEQVDELLAVRHEVRRVHEAPDVPRPGLAVPVFQYVLGVYHAYDVVEVLLVDGDPRAAVLVDEGDELLYGRRHVQGHHVSLGDHDLAHRGVLEHDDVVDHVALLLVYEALLLHLVQELLDLVVPYLLRVLSPQEGPEPLQVAGLFPVSVSVFQKNLLNPGNLTPCNAKGHPKSIDRVFGAWGGTPRPS